MKDSIAAIVILYNPNEEEVLFNISSYIKSVDKLYIFLNSNIKTSFLKKLISLDNIEIVNSNGENLGISKALNSVLLKVKNKYKWLLTMDQDTFFKSYDFNLFLEDFSVLDKQDLLIYSPIHNIKFLNKEEKVVSKEYVMTSGNIINVEKTLCIDSFDENLFIDEVDHEFCFRVLENGYKIIENQSISVNHILGEKIANKSFYPPLRLYYMIRNYFYLRRKYLKKHNNFFENRDKYLFIFILRHIFYSTKRIEIFKMIIYAFKDYKNKKYGKYDRK